MAQILALSNGRKLDVDRIFQDAGKPPVMAMLGGHKTIFEKGTPPKVTIYQKGRNFFTLDGKPVTSQSLQPWLDDPDFPESLKEEFTEFLEKATSGKAVRERLDRVRKQKPARRKEVRLRPEDAGLSSQVAERV